MHIESLSCDLLKEISHPEKNAEVVENCGGIDT